MDRPGRVRAPDRDRTAAGRRPGASARAVDLPGRRRKIADAFRPAIHRTRTSRAGRSAAQAMLPGPRPGASAAGPLGLRGPAEDRRTAFDPRRPGPGPARRADYRPLQRLAPAQAAAALKVAPGALRGAILHVQRLLNVEGYAVLRIDADGSTVILDEPLLREQFGVEG